MIEITENEEKINAEIGTELEDEKKEAEEKEAMTPEETVETEEKDENDRKSSRKAKKEETAAAKKLEELEKKYDELNDRYMRMMAEYDNFRKRAAKEKDGIYSDAYGDALKEILPIVDNLERAAKYSEGEKVLEGLNMTLNQFTETLKKLGVEEIDTNGTFDPNYHNAVMHTEDESLGENAIVEVFQKGYRKDEKVIRYAMVKVAN